MRVLILSCNTGEGHNAAGRAVADYVRSQGHEAIMQDIMLLAGPRTSKVVGGSYVGIVQHSPRFFQLLYRVGGAISSSKRRSPVYYANALMANRLKHFLDNHSFDVIVAPHLFAAETLTCLKKRGQLSQKVVGIATDYTCIPFWEETNCDYYILPHPDLVEEFAAKGIPREKLLPYGIPVRMSFMKKVDAQRAKHVCGIPKDAHTYLVMGGSMGFGRMQTFVSQLAAKSRKDEYVIIICGSNNRLENTLKETFHTNSRVRVLGFTNHVPEYMSACDVVFTKPGGLTSTEAAVKNIPIVHTNPIPGCETQNLTFFLQRGMSASSKDILEQIGLGQKLLRQRDVREAMIAAQRAQINPYASRDIFQLLLRLTQEEQPVG